MITMRVSSQSMSFSQVDLSQPTGLQYVPFIMRSGVSLAANLRQAIQDIPMLSQGDGRIRVLIDSPVLVVPVQEYDEEKADVFYRHAFEVSSPSVIKSNVLPALNTVVLYAVNKDFNSVLCDHYQQVSYLTVMQPVWRQLYNRSFTGSHRKLFAYFHDGKMDVCAFQQGRFLFSNVFEQSARMDIVYYLLHVWKLLGMDVHQDELHIVGDIRERDALQDELHRYLSNVYFISPTGEYNRAPITQIKNLPYDLITLYIKGR